MLTCQVCVLRVDAVDFGWVVPICTINYTSRYLLNTVALPVCLIGLVATTWAFNGDAEPLPGQDIGVLHDEMKANKRADYYFAFFLSCECTVMLWQQLISIYLTLQAICRLRVADPTMTQTFFGHFSCRRISTVLSVLHTDYDVLCYEGSQWWILAVVSVLGLLVVSIGFPVGMALWMRHTMSAEMHKVRHKGKGRAIAYRDFRRQFSYIAVSQSRVLLALCCCFSLV